MNLSVFIATSLDGFIARENGAIDWLPTEPLDGPDEDYGYKKFMGSVYALIMGRNTFETVLGFGAWPYGDKPAIVLSRGQIEIPEAIRGTVEAMSGTPAEVAKKMSERGCKSLYSPPSWPGNGSNKISLPFPVCGDGFEFRPHKEFEPGRVIYLRCGKNEWHPEQTQRKPI